MSDETIKQANKALEEFGEKFAEMVCFTQELFRKMTPEQRTVVEFLAENPKVAEAFQEMNQKLARQRAIEGATKEAAQPKEPLIKDEKVRKALRNYAEVFNWKSARYSSANNAFVNQGDMFFVRPSWELEQLEQLGYIPIDELCGEDEE